MQMERKCSYERKTEIKRDDLNAQTREEIALSLALTEYLRMTVSVCGKDLR